MQQAIQQFLALPIETHFFICSLIVLVVVYFSVKIKRFYGHKQLERILESDLTGNLFDVYTAIKTKNLRIKRIVYGSHDTDLSLLYCGYRIEIRYTPNYHGGNHTLEVSVVYKNNCTIDKHYQQVAIAKEISRNIDDVAKDLGITPTYHLLGGTYQSYEDFDWTEQAAENF